MNLSGQSIAANGGEGENQGCNGQGNVNSPCTSSNNNSNKSVNVNTNDASAISYAYGGQGGNATLGIGISSTGGIASGGNATGGIANSTSQGGNASVVGSGNSSASNSVLSSGNNTGSSTTTVNYNQQAQERNPVTSAIGPTISTGNDQCLVAVSGGVQAVGFGISLGSAVADKTCEAIKLSRLLASMGLPVQALKLLANADERVKEVLTKDFPELFK